MAHACASRALVLWQGVPGFAVPVDAALKAPRPPALEAAVVFACVRTLALGMQLECAPILFASCLRALGVQRVALCVRVVERPPTWVGTSAVDGTDFHLPFRPGPASLIE